MSDQITEFLKTNYIPITSAAAVGGDSDRSEYRHRQGDSFRPRSSQTSRQETSDGFEQVFGKNHLGPFLLTNLLLDLLKKSAPSRIVNVSSSGHAEAKINFDDINSTESFEPVAAYCRSKLANILFTKELAERLKGTGITCYSLHPGFVATDVFRAACHIAQCDSASNLQEL
ncbi:retinol dehydrogenase 11-like [Antedon mediterranea]|uniref:retinol dehydrogenase 11-like n=1 Tax=Antedon mediterranea TaxID=105859 RepID=UPI003AF7CBEC